MHQARVLADMRGVLFAKHLTASTLGRNKTLTEPERASWLRPKLRAAFPEAFSAVLLPDHMHLVVPPGRPALLANVLNGFTLRFGVRFEVLEPTEANGPHIALRTMVYGLWNPVPRYASDPYAWPWSTLRDLTGAAYPIWNPAEAVRRSLRFDTIGDLVHHLSARDGVRAPPLRHRSLHAVGLPEIGAAVSAALRIPVTEIPGVRAGRRLFIQAAFHVGCPRLSDVRRALGCGVSTVWRNRQRPKNGLSAVLACLADSRIGGIGTTGPLANAG